MSIFFKKRSEKGFTLIELLVVIAIIGILSSVVLASLNSGRVKARDTRRVADLKQIQVAQELYYDANGFYASALLNLVGSSGGASLATPPLDPQAGGAYSYAYKGTSPAITAYHVGANMEQALDATTLDSGDVDMTTVTGESSWVGGIVGGVAGEDTASNCAGVASTGFCYDVSNVNTP